MQLTEQQIQDRSELFLELISDIAEELYEVSEDHEPTEDELYIASILMDHFVENLKVPTLNESVMLSVTGIGPNQDLYEEMIELMLDESLGSMVAGAVYGIQNKIADYRRNRMEKKVGVAQAKAKAARLKSQEAQKASQRSTPFGAAKAEFLKNKAKVLANKRETAKGKFAQRISSQVNVQNKRQGLASKIDTGISNIKQKAKSAIAAGAGKLGALAGRFA